MQERFGCVLGCHPRGQANGVGQEWHEGLFSIHIFLLFFFGLFLLVYVSGLSELRVFLCVFSVEWKFLFCFLFCVVWFFFLISFL